MNLRLKLPLLMAVASALVFASTGYFAYRSQFDYVKETQVQQVKAIALALKSGFDAQARGASAQAEFIANLGSVKAALRAGNREALAAQLVPIYTLMAAKRLAEHASFQTPDLKVFLTLERVEEFGQDVSGHETIVRANRYRETQSGVEVTAGGLNICAVAPVDDGNTHLGSFKWGVGLGRLLERIKQNTGAEISVFVDRPMIAPESSSGTARGSAEAELSGQGLVPITSTNAELVGKLLSSEFLAGTQDEVYATADYEGVEYGVFAFPLFDFAGRQIGVIGGARSMQDSLGLVRGMRTLFMVATGIGVSLVALLVVLLSNRMLLRPLSRLEADVARFANAQQSDPQNDPQDEEVQQQTRGDEFGTVAKSLHKLREKLREEASVREDARLALRAKAARLSQRNPIVTDVR